MDERLEADDLAADDKDDKGKDSEPKEKKLKLQLSIQYTTWWQIWQRAEYTAWGVRLVSFTEFPSQWLPVRKQQLIFTKCFCAPAILLIILHALSWGISFTLLAEPQLI